jgi:hypothetical protein
MTTDKIFGEPRDRRLSGGLSAHMTAVLTAFASVPTRTLVVPSKHQDEGETPMEKDLEPTPPEPGKRLTKGGVSRPKPFYRKNQRW